MATVLDLTHPITEGMPVYPGCIPPTIRQANTVEKAGYAEKFLSIYTHTGTHIDAPAHMLAGGKTLDQLGAGHFVGKACVVDVSSMPTIEKAFLESQEGFIHGCDFVLFHTGWAQHWGSQRYFENFPVLALAAAQWLSGRGLKGLGFDAISIDPVGSTDFQNHLVLFHAGMISIENLKNLNTLIGKRFLFSCLPLSIEAADGSPVRAVALFD